ncbi:hypothetical protein [Idiomarina sp. OT37-5b]|uniref:hypothetical protein n=1 Tax=Idiomarina sp. OT37-5b TaxID=2100422 RepID=UPI001319EBF6|nr:hypothetical protein [Idiomarina sp. OT37-5b]
MIHFRSSIVFLVSCGLTFLTYAQSTVELKYDAKGRLIGVDKGADFIEYTYDSAGNRQAVGNERLSGGSSLIITEFNVPNIAYDYGLNASANWNSTGASYCEISFENQVNTYENLPTAGSKPIEVYTSGAVFLTCFNGSGTVQESDYIRHEAGYVIMPF